MNALDKRLAKLEQRGYSESWLDALTVDELQELVIALNELIAGDESVPDGERARARIEAIAVQQERAAREAWLGRSGRTYTGGAQ
jgi:hypothetical protein